MKRGKFKKNLVTRNRPPMKTSPRMCPI